MKHVERKVSGQDSGWKSIWLTSPGLALLSMVYHKIWPSDDPRYKLLPERSLSHQISIDAVQSEHCCDGMLTISSTTFDLYLCDRSWSVRTSTISCWSWFSGTDDPCRSSTGSTKIGRESIQRLRKGRGRWCECRTVLSRRRERTCMTPRL